MITFEVGNSVLLEFITEIHFKNNTSIAGSIPLISRGLSPYHLSILRSILWADTSYKGWHQCTINYSLRQKGSALANIMEETIIHPILTMAYECDIYDRMNSMAIIYEPQDIPPPLIISKDWLSFIIGTE